MSFLSFDPGTAQSIYSPKNIWQVSNNQSNQPTTKANTMASISDFFYRVSRDSKELIGLNEHVVRYILKFQEYGVDSGSTKACIDAADKYQNNLYLAILNVSESIDGNKFYEERIDDINDVVKYFENIEENIQEARDNEEMCEEDYFSDDGAISEDDDTEDDGELTSGELDIEDIIDEDNMGEDNMGEIVLAALDIEDHWEEE